MSGANILTAVVPHWHNEEELTLLVRSWPRDPRFELYVIDNGSDWDTCVPVNSRPNVSVLKPAENLGFAGAVNRGARGSGELLLILNPDARPLPGALESLLQGMAEHPEAAGLAPRLLSDDGSSQAAWQLRRLPTLGTLLGYCCFIDSRAGREPPAGAQVEQPAACALLLRREVFDAVGGMDASFWPAWFEDVDLAHRLKDRGKTIRYWPDAEFRHGLGASVARLGYGPFLLAYYRNLDRYARKHHSRSAVRLLRCVLTAAALVRIALLPLRCPRRARDRGEALAGLRRLAAAAAKGWKDQ